MGMIFIYTKNGFIYLGLYNELDKQKNGCGNGV